MKEEGKGGSRRKKWQMKFKRNFFEGNYYCSSCTAAAARLAVEEKETPREWGNSNDQLHKQCHELTNKIETHEIKSQ